MNDEGSDVEEIPEIDFSRGIQPHRYARLRPGYQYAVYLDRELWEHFGSADEVVAALRALVAAANHVKGKREGTAAIGGPDAG